MTRAGSVPLDGSPARDAASAVQQRYAGGVRRVALLGPYASRNLGDTAIQMAAIQNLRARRSDAQIVGISPDPQDTLASLGIASFPLHGRGPASGQLARPLGMESSGQGGAVVGGLLAARRTDAFAKSLDLLIISGGGQLDDHWGGVWGHPWMMLKWTALARRHGVPVAFLGVGMDRLSTRLGRHFALAALRLASYRAFRDAGTQTTLQGLGLAKPSVVCPDLAFSLGFDADPVPATSSQRRFAVINPISHKTWSHSSDARHAAYLAQLADASAWLAQQGLMLRVVCSQPTMDQPDAVRLAQMLADRGVTELEVCDIQRVDDYLTQVRGAEVVIAARLHGALLAMVAGSPVVALSPMPKVRQLMNDVGLPHLCLPLQDFSAGQLIAVVAAALPRANELRAHIAQVHSRYRAHLAQTFDEVVALLDNRGSPHRTR